ncbi:helix-turn-helix domain-containing protein [Corallococcus sp. CA053C]|uniref:helix-turn-helix domain-containing protein n=1 Tax=Corallococcus sp. CA053C TaxID=2316732 RepID=UPI001315771D|nr:helix-turn-helix transcriptional regulator [Corallococcus sp. CA053C]
MYRDLQQRLAAAVRRLRQQRDWTQEEAAHRSGMTVRVYQRVEGEEVNLTLTTIARIAEGFEVDPVELFKVAKNR